MKRIARLTPLLGILAVVATGFVAGASSAAVATPTNLHGFMLRATEDATTTFHRTPSFAWRPTAGAVHYELQLSTSKIFQQNGVIFDSRAFLTPVAAPDLTLPWITGSPHSLYARVRAILANGGTSPWSARYGFDVVPPAPPTEESSYDGLLHWSQVEGATGYQVWLLDAGKVETTDTNVLDEREYYAFHANASWVGDVRWRVRALRSNVIGQLNGIPVATHGPWSQVYQSANATPTTAPIHLVGTLSDSFSSGGAASKAHALMPGFVWTGNETATGVAEPFARVEVFTDSSCLNRVWTSATVASPAVAPRIYGTLAMPTKQADVDLASTGYLPDGTEDTDYTEDGDPLIPADMTPAASPTLKIDGSNALTVGNPAALGAPVDLWDTDWPSSGYYWTVVPVGMATGTDGTIYYYDAEVPQDVCAEGRVQRFGISSEPSLTAHHVAFASGLSARGGLVSASLSTKFYGQPLVAWTPVAAGLSYEVQWSKSSYPFKPAGTRLTWSTSIVLPLRPGTYWYRVRGIDYNIPSGAQEMTWSNQTKIVVAAPQLTIK
jgi:hypothetical protein